ncbi:MAG: CoA pyrophosphatase [Pseudomonadales bacterium]|nr:CoA pyrophosphatase [Pseudomonadales bacterium]
MSRFDLDSLQTRLRQRPPRPPSVAQPSHHPAAVLLLIYPNLEGELELVLTRRCSHLRNHGGQISLPGGRVELADQNRIHTALRETREEIGVNIPEEQVLTCLEDSLLPSGFCVTPVVAAVDRKPSFRADPSEVAEIFSIPLELVLTESLYCRAKKIRNGIKREFYCFDYKEYYIWGATASILRSLSLELNDSMALKINQNP